MHYLEDGWQLEKLAAVESYYHAGVRRTDIYYFTLTRGEEHTEMPVVANPMVLRLIESNQLTVIRVNGGPEF